MIQQKGPIRLITEDTPENQIGDLALVRITLGRSTGYAVLDGWSCVGLSVTGASRSPGYSDAVYIFLGAP